MKKRIDRANESELKNKNIPHSIIKNEIKYQKKRIDSDMINNNTKSLDLIIIF